MKYQVGNRVNARANLDVVGWTADQSVLNESLCDEVVAYVTGALEAGLDAEAIEVDLMDRWGGLFASLSVEVAYSCRKASASILAFAAPCQPAVAAAVVPSAAVI